MCTFKIPTAAVLAGLLCLISVPLSAQHPTVAPLMTKELKDLPGKEALMLTVEFAPGGADPIHRHTFYEGPDDVHLVGRNASSTRPAKLLAVLLKNQGAPPLVLVDE